VSIERSWDFFFQEVSDQMTVYGRHGKDGSALFPLKPVANFPGFFRTGCQGPFRSLKFTGQCTL